MTDVAASRSSPLQEPAGSNAEYLGLLKPVDRFRRRVELSGTLGVAVGALSFALSAVAVVELLTFGIRWLDPQVLEFARGWAPAGTSTLVKFAIWTFILAYAGATIFLGVREVNNAPTTLSLASRIDRGLGLRERLSTALEFGTGATSTSSSGSLMRAAQFADAVSSTRDLDLRPILPAYLPSRWWLAIALVVLAAVLAVVYGPTEFAAPAARPTAPTMSEHLSAEERAETAKSLDRVVQLLNAAPVGSKTPYLTALARTIEALGADVANTDVRRGDLTQRLGELSSQIDQAFGTDTSSGTHDQIASALQDQIGKLRQGPVATPAPPGMTSAGESNDSAGQSPPLGGLPTPDGSPKDQSAKVSFPAAQKSSAPAGSYYTIDQAQAERNAQEAAQMQAQSGGKPVGVAQDSSTGGNKAGSGARPIADVALADDITVAAKRKADDVVLPEQDAGKGQRIKINVAPPPQSAEMVAEPGLGPNGNWRATPEAPVGREQQLPDQQDVLARYFSLSDAGGG